MKKRIICFILSIFICTSVFTIVSADGDIYSSVINYLIANTPNPSVGSLGGDWVVITLAKSGYENDNFYETYYNNVCDFVSSNQSEYIGRLATDNARVALAVTAAGYNPSDVGGYNLLAPILSFEYATKQGINGAIYTLMALDACNYESDMRDSLLSYIMSKYIPGGGWSFTGDFPDPDITAMTIRALAPYYDVYSDVQSAIDMSISVLSILQEDDGGYSSWGAKNAETSAQVLCTLSVMNVDINDERFVKNGNTVLDALLGFYDSSSGGFKHIYSGDTDQMATEQAAYALALYNSDKTKTFYVDDDYDSDTITFTTADDSGFTDISDSKYKSEIESLCSRSIINGKSASSYDPYSNVTRAEFAAIITKALGLSRGSNSFSDVSESDWFYDCVSAAYSSGIINGISDTEFAPHKTITREEAAVMCARALKPPYMDTSEKNTLLTRFTDYLSLSNWAVDETAYCIKKNIIDNDCSALKPYENIKRDEAAYMIFNMLN